MDIQTSFWKKCALFQNIPESLIREFLEKNDAGILSLKKGELVFHEEDEPKGILILLSGSIVVGSNTLSGKRQIVTTIDRPGEIFGEVFLFMRKTCYGHYAEAQKDSRILRIPERVLMEPGEVNSRILENMLSILASKAFYLNRRLQIVTCSSLRQKIAKTIAMSIGGDFSRPYTAGREELADFIGAARPSVSRELMNMQREGLVRVEGRKIFLAGPEVLDMQE
ncbi:MAG: Crp/Fnr family transcriptional regulator [Clostridium sp.]|nr:Crp/Fnr family transcriptional regulator [Clostridium sp.]